MSTKQSLKPNLLASFLLADRNEAGCDEAGRGCLAGPVFAAAVILPPNYENAILNDSKQLSEKIRYQLRPEIETDAVEWAVGIVSAEEIDQINILNASILAMHRALDQLKLRPEHLIIDGNRFKKYRDIPHQCIVKGDSKYLSIAAASILAKTYRDDYMNAIHEDYPMYHWLSNKGYPTVRHRDAIREFGISPHHRKSFRLLENQTELEF
ncbi:MAG: rnhB [Bacteroidetes bacterium]|nr:rnhB [Bacteroidota bacterium]